ncbi:MAG: serine/threonine-protein kinase [Sorangiineae bacterium]|nr:serine/threonine-protein kinase [Polyangiaceae bacterium]MEB2323520.1 serine/threonine-protein kinase [Sorangiineae bacterium]
MTDPFVPGAVLANRYEVVRVVGRGGMGVVLAVRRTHLDDIVAMKVLLPEAIERSDLVARFLREARATAKFRSERIARIFDVDTLANGAPFMVMELLDGKSLDLKLKAAGTLPVPEAVGIVMQACEALAEAHAMGVIHRDLKPSNLMLVTDADGEPGVKLLDFGVSKVQEAAAAALTSADGVVGSPAYMSPEQISNAADVDARTDVWSLGVILYELVSGARPFAADGLAALLMQIVSEPPRPLGEVAPWAPASLGAIVARCLNKGVDGRFADVVALAAALAELGGPDARRSLGRAKHARDAALKRGGAPESAAERPTVPVPAAEAQPTEHMSSVLEEARVGSASRSSASSTGSRAGRSDDSSGSRPRGAIDSRSSQTLMATLKGHHLSIKLTAKQIGTVLASSDASAAPALFRRLRELIETHVRLEDARLYPELEHLADQTHDADMVELVTDFATSMSEIGAVLTSFFERHASMSDLALAREEWPDVSEALFSRLSAEELSLYPLHRDLAGAKRSG